MYKLMATNKRIVKVIIVIVGLFLSASLIGHWLEMVWVNLGIILFGSPDQFGVLDHGLFHMAPVYGIGALGCVTIGYFVNKHFKNIAVKIIICFITCTIICSIAEYVTAAIIVASYGYNPYWDYSNMFLNLHGYICLQNSLLFGILGTVLSLSSIPVLLGDWIMETE